MVCSKCGGKTKVIDNSNTDEEIYRLRVCTSCNRRFYTVEYEVEYTESLINTWNLHSRQRHRNKKIKEKK